MSSFGAEELVELQGIFRAEAEEYLEELRRALAEARAGPAGDAFGAILRKLHTLKGAAGSVELHALSDEVHQLEADVLSWRQAGPAGPLGARESERLEAAFDHLAEQIAVLGQAPAPAPHGDPGVPAGDSVDLPPSAVPGFERRRAPRETIRVEMDRIDAVMDAASELVFDRARLARRFEELRGSARDLTAIEATIERLGLRPLDPAEMQLHLTEVTLELGHLADGLHAALAAAAENGEQLRRTSARLQEGVRRVRMLTVGPLFSRLGPSARELGRREGKRVVVAIDGGDTEIDKRLVEGVAEPLMHLCRNAVVHGIEPPDERVRAGKPPDGELRLSARLDGAMTEIVVADDGRGIDAPALRAALLRTRPDLGAAKLAQLDETQLLDTLFWPGVSTRGPAAIDEHAGRGIGLDAVRAALDVLGGEVQVASTPGQGTRFIVRVPRSSAVEEALLFKLAGQVYGVPITYMREVLRVGPEDVVTTDDGERVRVRDELLPLCRLGALVGAPLPSGAVRQGLLLEVSGTRFCVTCDRVIGPREIVVRALPSLLGKLRLFAGATVSGSGRVQAIFDVRELRRLAESGIGERDARSRAPRQRRVLLVDDSRSVQQAGALMLRSEGFIVDMASDGWEAWERLQDRAYDLVLADLEMPRIDGYGLLARLRGSAELSRMPVLIMSSRTLGQAQDRCRELGADGFFAKPLRRRPLVDEINAILTLASAPEPQHHRAEHHPVVAENGQPVPLQKL